MSNLATFASSDAPHRVDQNTPVEKLSDGGVVIAKSEAAFELLLSEATTQGIDGLARSAVRGEALVKPVLLKLVRYEKEDGRHTYKLVAYKYMKEQSSNEIILKLSKEAELEPKDMAGIQLSVCSIKEEHQAAITAAYTASLNNPGADDALKVKLYHFKLTAPIGDWMDRINAVVQRIGSFTSQNKPTKVHELELGFLDAAEARGWHAGIAAAIGNLQKDDPAFMAIAKTGGATKMEKSTANRLAASWGLAR